MKRTYGWKKSEKPSPHPLFLTLEHHKTSYGLPPAFDLTPQCPAVYDQGQLGSCTANAWAGIVQFLLLKQGLSSFVPSRLMIYWGERAIEGTKTQDAGAIIDDGMTFLMDKGVCRETTWPYDTDKFAIMPPTRAWAEAYHTKLSDPVTIADGDIIAIKSWLVSEHVPVAFGFVVFPSFESELTARTGNVVMPQPGEQSIGGHAIEIVGYNDETRMFKIRNSWNPSWGIGGYALMPYDYVGNTQLANDFRSAKKVS